MIPSSLDDKPHLIETGHPLVPRLLRCAAISGANASGKSKLLEAMEVARGLVLSGTQRPDEPIQTDRFRLDPGYARKPSVFEFLFLAQGKLYAYGIAVKPNMVQEEWLTERVGLEEERSIFERKTDAKGRVKVRFDKGYFQKSASLVEHVTQATRANQPFLTECARQNVLSLKEVYRWFTNLIVMMTASYEWELAIHSDIHRNLKEEDQWLHGLSRFIRAMDTGIESIKIKKERISRETYLERVPTFMVEDQQGVTVLDQWGDIETLYVENGKHWSSRFESVRLDSKGKEIVFSFKEESAGTQRMVFLFLLVTLLSDKATVLVDELHLKLHPNLTRFFLDEVLSGPAQGQLIFTSHELGIWDLLRKDEVWLLEKGRDGAASISALHEYEYDALKEGAAAWQKAYLLGRFGGVPKLHREPAP